MSGTYQMALQAAQMVDIPVHVIDSKGPPMSLGWEEEARAIANRIQEEHGPLELLVNITGPVLGINTGPGALALCGYAED